MLTFQLSSYYLLAMHSSTHINIIVNRFSKGAKHYYCLSVDVFLTDNTRSLPPCTHLNIYRFPGHTPYCTIPWNRIRVQTLSDLGTQCKQLVISVVDTCWSNVCEVGPTINHHWANLHNPEIQYGRVLMPSKHETLKRNVDPLLA